MDERWLANAVGQGTSVKTRVVRTLCCGVLTALTLTAAVGTAEAGTQKDPSEGFNRQKVRMAADGVYGKFKVVDQVPAKGAGGQAGGTPQRASSADSPDDQRRVATTKKAIHQPTYEYVAVVRCAGNTPQNPLLNYCGTATTFCTSMNPDSPGPLSDVWRREVKPGGGRGQWQKVGWTCFTDQVPASTGPKPQSTDGLPLLR